MAWSIFSEGGGKGSAVTYAQDLLKSLGVPQSKQNVQFVYDWEVSEGGGGAYNPLNIGPVGNLASSGTQYGGGAADYPSYAASIQAVTQTVKSSYKSLYSALQQSSYSGAEQALWASPWAASHYGYGSNWSTETPPGATPIDLGGSVAGSDPNASTTSLIPGISVSSLVQSAVKALLGMFGLSDLKDMLERAGLIILGFTLIILGIHLLGQADTAKTYVQNQRGSGDEEETEEEAPAEEEEAEKPAKTTEKAAGKASKGVGAEEAVEAAAVA